jgi:hypothetical protein
MSARAGIGAPSNYVSQVFILVRTSATQLVRRPSHSRRAEAARRSARHVLLLAAILGAAIIALMYALDVAEIGLMPPRGTASLWPVRILTDFGKSAYVLWLLAGILAALALTIPRWRGSSRSPLLSLGTHLQFVFFAVLVPVLAVRRRRSQRLQLRSLRRDRSLCQLPIGPRHYQLCAGVCGFRGLAAGAARDDRVCHSDRHQPPRAVGPSSERRGRRCADRRGRRDVGAILVRRTPLGVRDPPRWRHCAARGTLIGAP